MDEKPSKDVSKSIDVLCMGTTAVSVADTRGNDEFSPDNDRLPYITGNAANTAIGLARQGLNVALFSCLGQDPQAEFAISYLQDQGINLDLLQQNHDACTAIEYKPSINSLPPNTLSFNTTPADNPLLPKHVKEQLIKQSAMLVFYGTGISNPAMRETTELVLTLAKKHQVQVAFDLDYQALYWQSSNANENCERSQKKQCSQHYQAFLAYCDVIIGTEKELCLASACEKVSDAIDYLMRHTDAEIVFKKGLVGSEVFSNSIQTPIYEKAFPIKKHSSYGAANAFLSSLLSARCREQSWPASLRLANAASAIICSRAGCADALPNLDELDFFIQNYAQYGPNIVNHSYLNHLHLGRQFEAISSLI